METKRELACADLKKNMQCDDGMTKRKGWEAISWASVSGLAGAVFREVKDVGVRSQVGMSCSKPSLTKKPSHRLDGQARNANKVLGS